MALALLVLVLWLPAIVAATLRAVVGLPPCVWAKLLELTGKSAPRELEPDARNTRRAYRLLCLAIWSVPAFLLSGVLVLRDNRAAIFVVLLFVLAAFRFAHRELRYAHTWNVGSARRLVGDCAVFQVFVGPWTSDERRERLQLVGDACAWLESQAAGRGVEARFLLDALDELLLDDVELPLAWFESISTAPHDFEVGYQDFDRVGFAVRYIAPLAIARKHALSWTPPQYLLLCHVHAQFTAFAQPNRHAPTRDALVDVAVLGRRVDAVVAAHEILHLFGAPDLYFDPAQEFPNLSERRHSFSRIFDSLVRQGRGAFHDSFKGSIMNSTYGGFDAVIVDDVTATCIGWPVPRRAYRRQLRRHDKRLGFAMVFSLLGK